MADPRGWPELGDMPAQDFRTALHRVADWIADYREGIENLKISPDSKAGEIAAQLPAMPPDEAVPFQDIFQEFQRNNFARHCPLGTSTVLWVFRFDDDCSRDSW